jgi:ABC-2 type transport system permease protein
MAKLLAIIGREYMERVRSRWFVFATVFGPITFAALMILPSWLSRRTTASEDVARIAILDATGVGLGARIASELNGGIGGDTARTKVQLVQPENLDAAERAATEAALRREIRGYLVLDTRTVAGIRARYVGTNASAVSDMQVLQRVVREAVMGVRFERAGVQPTEVRSLLRARVELDAQRLTQGGGSRSARVSIMFAFAIALLLYMSIFVYGQNVLRGVLEEKQTRVAEVVMSSVPASKLLAGKVLGVGAVGITQLILWISSSLLLLEVRGAILSQLGIAVTPLPLPDINAGQGLILLLFFLLGYTFYAALFAAIGAMVSSEHEAQQAQLPIVLLLVSNVVFIEPVLRNPESTMARLLGAIPFTAPIIMPLRMSVIGLSTLDVVLSLISVAGGCYIAVFIAARIYRVGMLMYGKRPRLRELARWLRPAR